MAPPPPRPRGGGGGVAKIWPNNMLGGKKWLKGDEKGENAYIVFFFRDVDSRKDYIKLAKEASVSVRCFMMKTSHEHARLFLAKINFNLNKKLSIFFFRIFFYLYQKHWICPNNYYLSKYLLSTIYIMIISFYISYDRGVYFKIYFISPPSTLEQTLVSSLC